VRNPPSSFQIAFLRQYGELFPSSNFAYVTIHPLADDAETLQRLNISPDDCTACDLYWALGHEIAFVGVGACEQTLANPPGGKISRDPGVHVYVDPEDPMVRFHFNISTRRSPITTATIETVLAWLENWYYTNAPVKENFLTCQSISDVDIVC
jgi:hypothetical protein